MQAINYGQYIYGRNKASWRIARIEEVPGANCQGRTRQELLDSLRPTPAEALEFNRADATHAAVPDYTEELVAV